MQKSESLPTPHTIFKNYLKMGHRPKWIPKPTKFLEENIGKNTCELIHKRKEKIHCHQN